MTLFPFYACRAKTAAKAWRRKARWAQSTCSGVRIRPCDAACTRAARVPALSCSKRTRRACDWRLAATGAPEAARTQRSIAETTASRCRSENKLPHAIAVEDNDRRVINDGNAKERRKVDANAGALGQGGWPTPRDGGYDGNRARVDEAAQQAIARICHKHCT